MKKILIIGESCVDEYVYGTCTRICPEAPAICFCRSSTEIIKSNIGMAGNVMLNMSAINKNNQIDIITNIQALSIIKRRFIDSRYNAIVFREDINDFSDPLDPNKFEYSGYDAIVFSDYNKGFISEYHYEMISDLCSDNTVIFADTKKKITKNIARYVDFLKINNNEFRENISDINEISSYCSIIITQGSNGASLIDHASVKNFPTLPIEIRDVCGAGDTFLASLVTNYLETKNIEDSIVFANQCSSKVVSKFGVCIP